MKISISSSRKRGLTPDLRLVQKYLKNNMNMLWQYLEANCRKFDTSIWGVSALGGKLDDFEELLDIEDPIMRIKVINENKSISHDVTSIIAEMSGETNGY